MIIYTKERELIILNEIRLLRFIEINDQTIEGRVINSNTVEYISVAHGKCIRIDTRKQMITLLTNNGLTYKFPLINAFTITENDLFDLFTKNTITNSNVLSKTYILTNHNGDTITIILDDKYKRWWINNGKYEYLKIDGHIIIGANDGFFISMPCKKGKEFSYQIDCANLNIDKIQGISQICGKYDIFETYENIKLLGILPNQLSLNNKNIICSSGIVTHNDTPWLVMGTNDKISLSNNEKTITVFLCGFNSAFMCNKNGKYILIPNKTSIQWNDIINEIV
jgi:hypothetical protein